MGPASTTRGQTEATAYADHLEWWRAQLSSRGMEMAVLIIPTRYTVYAPVIEEASRRASAVTARSFLHMFEAELMRRGLTTVNAMRVFEASLDRELRTGSLSFFRDDNHWNGAGVELVAQSVAEVLRKARAARHPAGRSEEASRH